jgi:hypothetical protein
VKHAENDTTIPVWQCDHGRSRLWTWKPLTALIVAVVTAVLGIVRYASAQTPHDCGSKIQTTETHKRRQEGLRLVQNLNVLEKTAGTFVSLRALAGLEVPADFLVQLYGTTGQSGYILAVKDRRDACSVLFSDQSGRIYVGQLIF